MSNYRPPVNHFQNRNQNGPVGSRGASSSAAPRGYIPGIGRGAAGFTTRSDIGPMAAAPGGGAVGAASAGAAGAGGAGGDVGAHLSGSGSRSAELREAKMRMKHMQQQGSAAAGIGKAPVGYVAGLGRGAGFKGGGDADGAGPSGAPGGGGGGGEGGGTYDQFDGYVNDRLFGDTPYDDEDEEADKIYAAIDERMSSKGASKNKRRKLLGTKQDGEGGAATAQSVDAGGGSRIGDQFRELKEKLADVTEEQWMALPDVGDYSLRYKQKRREDVFTPLTDSLLESRTQANADATSGNAHMSKTTTINEDDTDGSSTGLKSVVTNMSGLAEARGTVLGMSLDKMSDSISGQTHVDPKGYLTSLSSVKIATDAEVGDVNKARLLLKSVRDTNPRHGPGWIASARVEEAAGKMNQARKIIQQGCEICPQSEDVWLEAARLHPPAVGKTILATAARRIPTSVKIFLHAADLEPHVESKKAVLRKGLEANPTSVTLWKAAIELEEAEDARVLLAVAVEKVPHSVEMWLALARLESYENARKVLNKARKKLPAERAVWIAAAKLEESQNHEEMVDKIMQKAVQSLVKHEAVVTRVNWLKEAEAAEGAGAPLTASAIVRYTVGMGVDDEDRQRTWSADAVASLSRGAVATSRAILAHALSSFPSKKSLWLQAVELERKHGSAASLDEVLRAASERLPRAEIFWLIRAKEKWLTEGQIDEARQILTAAFAANPDSEEIWLAAAKLEWETGEMERARVLLQRARERAGTARVYMKSVLLERECKRFQDALRLLEEGLSRFPKFEKLYMMGGQICSHDLVVVEKKTNDDDDKHGDGKNKRLGDVDRAREFYKRGLQFCPSSVVLWILASQLEETVSREQSTATNGNGASAASFTKARSLLEMARLINPKNPRLWLEATRLERRAGNGSMATTLMARALQECPSSGVLLAENISTSPRVEQKSKSADAIKKCPDDPHVISAVASLFASERKTEKARKWFERAVVLDPDLGDSWAKYYAFEMEQAQGSSSSSSSSPSAQAKKVQERCVKADPKHGEIWCSVTKDMANRHKTVDEGLELVAKRINELHQQQQQQK